MPLQGPHIRFDGCRCEPVARGLRVVHFCFIFIFLALVMPKPHLWLYRRGRVCAVLCGVGCGVGKASHVALRHTSLCGQPRGILPAVQSTTCTLLDSTSISVHTRASFRRGQRQCKDNLLDGVKSLPYEASAHGAPVGMGGV